MRVYNNHSSVPYRSVPSITYGRTCRRTDRRTYNVPNDRPDGWMDGRSIFTILKLLLLLLWSCWPLYGGVVLFGGGGCYWRFLLLVVRLDLTVTEFLLSFKKSRCVCQSGHKRKTTKSKQNVVRWCSSTTTTVTGLSLRPSVRPFIHPSIHQSMQPSICPSCRCCHLVF